MLDQYLKSFSCLRADKNRKRWSAPTTFQTTHKPFLLFFLTIQAHWCIYPIELKADSYDLIIV
jgi:hypothetical protein